MIVMARKGKDRNSIKKRRRLLILGTFSLTTIVFTTYTMGKYWVQIYDKKQERDKLSQELKKLNEREDTRPELDIMKQELQKLEQSNKYLGEMFDLVFQNSTLNQETKDSLAVLKNKMVFGVEDNLIKRIPKEFILDAHHWLILHGRYTCVARKPRCGSCLVYNQCQFLDKTDE